MVKNPCATQEIRVLSLGQKDPLEKKMATHSSIIAWRIPWTKEPGGEGSGTSLQYSCLENSMDGGVWWFTVHGVTKSWTELSDFTLLVVGTQICSFNTTKGCVWCRRAERSYYKFKVRRGGPDESPLIQGKKEWLCFA